jgi:LAO/AO transport system kinase
MVDFVLLLMLAGAGDELQGIKKGIIEIADGIAINKADGDNIPQTKRAQADLQHALHLLTSNDGDWIPKVVTCSSLTKTGLDEIWKMILAFKEQGESNGAWLETRVRQRRKWMEESVTEMMRHELKKYFGTLKVNINEYPPAAATRLWKNFLSHLK